MRIRGWWPRGSTRPDNDLEPPITGYSKQGWPRRDYTRLVDLMEQPLLIAGDRAPDKPVWHCILRNHESDRTLSDAEWGQIAHEVIARMGLDETDQHPGVPWVAVRHDQDGIHLAAILARDDGTIPSLWRDHYRIRQACNWAERTHGLRATNPGDRTTARRPTRAESEKATRTGRAEPARDTLRRLVRQAAAGAHDPAEFVTRLDHAGVIFQTRESTQVPGQITGYKVALRAHTTAGGRPIFYAGRSLAADLTWPKLIARWNDTATAAVDGPSAHGKASNIGGVYAEAIGAVRDAADIAMAPGLDDEALDDLAAGADAVITAAMYVKSGSYDGRRKLDPHTRRYIEAADSFERVGRNPGPRRRRTPAEATLSAAAVMRAVDAGDIDRAWLELATELSRLAGFIAEQRLRQHRTEQAAAARQAAGQLAALRHPVGLLAGLPGVTPVPGHGSAPPPRPRQPTAQARRRRSR